MAVKVLAGSVIAHRRPRVCVAGRDLDIPQVHARVELVGSGLPTVSNTSA